MKKMKTMKATTTQAGRRSANATSTATAAPKILRVAIYTRQSVTEENEQFGSIEAQRLAVEHFVQSQPGWRACPERYDDAGFTGANTDRPAFQRLLADVEAGKIDIVAVYKIDRLSRSLHDFTGLMARFDAKGVCFVSTTQAFNTATSVGRLTLNLLATFAQFERETIAERTRDKMQAARRRGYWVGGHIPLGYDVRDGSLVVNPEEAARVRAIFDLYQATGSLFDTVAELDRRGWRSKAWTNRAGKRCGGTRFDGVRLRRFLADPVYVGMVAVAGKLVPAQHAPIVDRATWDAVQAQIASRRAHPPTKPPLAWSALLTGILRCGECGASMSHTCVRRHGRAYRSYTCGTILKCGAAACPAGRVSAPEIEAFVVEKLRAGDAAFPDARAWDALAPQQKAEAVAARLAVVRYAASEGAIELVEKDVEADVENEKKDAAEAEVAAAGVAP